MPKCRFGIFISCVGHVKYLGLYRISVYKALIHTHYYERNYLDRLNDDVSRGSVQTIYPQR